MKAKMYFDFLSDAEIEELRKELAAGPQPAFEGVHPDADHATRMRIGTKQFNDKFRRAPFSCPNGIYYEWMTYDRRTIAERLEDAPSTAAPQPPPDKQEPQSQTSAAREQRPSAQARL